MADGVTEPYSVGMSEPAYEMTLEELADSPHSGAKRCDRWRADAWFIWSEAIMSTLPTSFLTASSKSWRRRSRSSLTPRRYAR